MGIDLAMANLLICERDFIVKASQERVWRLIGKVIFSSLPGMENVEILDENTFRALLRTKVFGMAVTLKIQGEIVDLDPPDSFSVKLFLEGPGGLFKADQKVSFAMSPKEGGNTGVVCKAWVERMGLFPRLFILGEAKRFAQATFASIENRLKDLA
jgi:carbon monoxide dehydrogenase subunit G